MCAITTTFPKMHLTYLFRDNTCAPDLLHAPYIHLTGMLLRVDTCYMHLTCVKKGTPLMLTTLPTGQTRRTVHLEGQPTRLGEAPGDVPGDAPPTAGAGAGDRSPDGAALQDRRWTCRAVGLNVRAQLGHGERLLQRTGVAHLCVDVCGCGPVECFV